MRRPILLRACARACPDCPRARVPPGRARVFAARPELARRPVRATRRRTLRTEMQSGSRGGKVSSDFRVYAQQVRNRFRGPAAETALGGDAEVARVFRRDGDTVARALDAVRVVHQPEEELRLSTQLKLIRRGA